MDQLPLARRSQYAALIRDEGVLVVWSDSINALIPSTRALELSVIALIQSGKRIVPTSPSNSNITALAALPVPDSADDVEKAEPLDTVRPKVLVSPISNGLALMIVAILMGLGLSKC